MQRTITTAFALLTLLALQAVVLAQTAVSAPTDLIEAASKGDLDGVQALLVKGTDVNGKRANGETALLVAAGKGQRAVVQALLISGADVNARTPKGVTALLVAAQNGYTEIVQPYGTRGRI